jgi:hypothetical protein
MPRPHRNLITTLALLALVCAQVFGLQRGYVCLCSDEFVETVAASCERNEPCCDKEHQGAPPIHVPLKVNHEAQDKTSTTLVIHAPMLVAILEFEAITGPSETHSSIHTALNRPPPGKDANPPASLLVAECKVLLI